MVNLIIKYKTHLKVNKTVINCGCNNIETTLKYWARRSIKNNIKAMRSHVDQLKLANSFIAMRFHLKPLKALFMYTNILTLTILLIIKDFEHLISYQYNYNASIKTLLQTSSSWFEIIDFVKKLFNFKHSISRVIILYKYNKYNCIKRNID